MYRVTKKFRRSLSGVMFNEETHGDLRFGSFGRCDTVLNQTTHSACPARCSLYRSTHTIQGSTPVYSIHCMHQTSVHTEQRRGLKEQRSISLNVGTALLRYCSQVINLMIACRSLGWCVFRAVVVIPQEPCPRARHHFHLCIATLITIVAALRVPLLYLPSHAGSCLSRNMGLTSWPYRASACPSLPTTNLVKFHSMAPSSAPPRLALRRNLYTSWVREPFTSAFSMRDDAGRPCFST